MLLSVPTTAGSGGGFELRNGSVGPERAYFAGKPLKIALTAADGQERPLRISVIQKRKRKTVRAWTIATTADAGRTRVRWNGRNDSGGVARDGRYVVRAGPAGRPSRRLGTFTWRRHAYPVAGPHADRGYIGTFGAPRSGGRSHQGFDINSPCGTRIVAARGGKVLKSAFDPKLMGNFVVIQGRNERLRYLYAHLRDPSPMRRGDRVRTAQLVGQVGLTGNAGGTPCHLHIELRDGGPVDPEPYLRRWDR